MSTTLSGTCPKMGCTMTASNRSRKGTYAHIADPTYARDRESWEYKGQEFLHRVMRERNLTIAQLGEHMGLSPGAVRHRLYGTKVIAYGEIMALCSSLDIDVTVLAFPDQPFAPFNQVMRERRAFAKTAKRQTRHAETG